MSVTSPTPQDVSSQLINAVMMNKAYKPYFPYVQLLTVSSDLFMSLYLAAKNVHFQINVRNNSWVQVNVSKMLPFKTEVCVWNFALLSNEDLRTFVQHQLLETSVTTRKQTKVVEVIPADDLPDYMKSSVMDRHGVVRALVNVHGHPFHEALHIVREWEKEYDFPTPGVTLREDC